MIEETAICIGCQRQFDVGHGYEPEDGAPVTCQDCPADPNMYPNYPFNTSGI